jgi:hypothetical protein
MMTGGIDLGSSERGRCPLRMQRNQYLEGHLPKCLKPVEKNGLRHHTYLILLYKNNLWMAGLKKPMKYQIVTFLCFLTIRTQYVVVLAGVFKT